MLPTALHPAPPTWFCKSARNPVVFIAALGHGLDQVDDVFRLGLAGNIFFRGPRRMAVDAAVVEILVLQVMLQGIDGFFEEEEDIFFLVSQVFQGLVIILRLNSRKSY